MRDNLIPERLQNAPPVRDLVLDVDHKVTAHKGSKRQSGGMSGGAMGGSLAVMGGSALTGSNSLKQFTDPNT